MDDPEERGRQASVNGFAHEHIVVGILMKKYKNVSLVDLPLSPYDIIIVRKLDDGREDIIRVQVKTAKKSISFTGGTRGGVDREYKSGVKTYVQSPKTSDCIVGINFDDGLPVIYFFPTLLIESIGQKSISIKKIKDFRYNYEILNNCKDTEFVFRKAREYGILPSSQSTLF
jgi:hypothetical protein